MDVWILMILIPVYLFFRLHALSQGLKLRAMRPTKYDLKAFEEAQRPHHRIALNGAKNVLREAQRPHHRIALEEAKRIGR